MQDVPLRGYRAPVAGQHRPIIQPARSTLRAAVPRPVGSAPRTLRRAVEGTVDVPATTLVGLVLRASGQP